MDIIPVFLDSFLRHFEHDKKHGFLIVRATNCLRYREGHCGYYCGRHDVQS